MDHHSHSSVFFLPRHSQAPVQAFPHVISEPKKISKPLELAEPCSGLVDSFHIDDLLDFTNEDIAGPIMDEPQPLQPPNSFINPCQIVETEKPNDGLSSISGVDDEDAKDLYFPCDDIAELEWLSNFVDDSFSTEDAAMPGLASVCVSLDTTESKHSSQLSYSSQDQFHVRSPVSVLESSASSGRGEMGSPSLIDMASTTNWAKTAIPAKARSKRTRNGLKVWPSQILTTPAVSETPSSTENSQQSTISWLDSIDGSVGNEISVDSKKQCRGFKKAGQDGQPRRCLHCLSQKTPQWRAGPLGPKTLCNACGVRYKSGRLFPEYRPALSPTFSVEKHSNSHRKVLEMRKMREFEPACDQPLLLNPPQHQEVGAILY